MHAFAWRLHSLLRLPFQESDHAIAVLPYLSNGVEKLTQQFDKSVGEAAQLFFALTVRPQTVHHALRHQLHHGALEGGASGGHLLRDRMTIAAVRNHLLDGPDLPFDAP